MGDFFLKASGALGSHVKFLDAHTDRTQCRRGCSSSLGTRHTKKLTPPHTLTPTTHARLSTWCDTRARPRRESNPGGRLHDRSAYHRATSARQNSPIWLRSLVATTTAGSWRTGSRRSGRACASCSTSRSWSAASRCFRCVSNYAFSAELCQELSRIMRFELSSCQEQPC